MNQEIDKIKQVIDADTNHGFNEDENYSSVVDIIHVSVTDVDNKGYVLSQLKDDALQYNKEEVLSSVPSVEKDPLALDEMKVKQDKEEEEALLKEEVIVNDHQDENSYFSNVILIKDEHINGNNENFEQNGVINESLLKSNSELPNPVEEDLNGKKVHKCNVCGKSFMYLSKLKRHEISHFGVRAHRCKLCGKSYSHLAHLKAHQKDTHKKTRLFKCENCEESFVSLPKLRQHEIIHMRVQPYKCNFCEKSFSTNYRMRAHEMIHTRNKPFKCDICEESFHYLFDLQLHLRNHTGSSRPYVCKYCGKSFTRVQHVIKHEKLHTEDKPYKCSVCKQSFSQSTDLKIHRECVHDVDNTGYVLSHLKDDILQYNKEGTLNSVPSVEKDPLALDDIKLKKDKEKDALLKQEVIANHQDENSYFSNVILIKDENFEQNGIINESSLKSNSESPNPVEENLNGKKVHKCNVCGKSFLYLSKLKLHEISHFGVRSHECNICGKSYSHLVHLKVHKNVTHKNITLFKCKKCEESFVSLSRLMQHEIIHMGVQPYKCNFCEKFFSTTYGMRAHEMIHTRDKPHKCEICEESFHYLFDLQLHLRKHTGSSRPYVCKYCGKPFTRVQHVIKHEKLHTEDKTYKCSICERSFSRSTDLKIHEKCEHEGKPFKCKICDKLFSQSSSLRRHEILHS